MLKFQSTPRHTAQTLILGVLGLAVFVWGLHYKISLYQSEAAQRSVPAARLFSQKERPVAGTQMEKRLRPGQLVAKFTHRVLGDTVAALPLNAHASAKTNTETIAGQSNPGGPHLQHLILADLRGPPIAI
jgi:hypothetical protein